MSGRATLLLGLALIFLGAAFDSPSLLVPGIALAFISLGLGAWVQLAARSTRLRRLPGPRSVVEDEPYPLRLRIEGARLPTPGASLDDPSLVAPLALGMRLPAHISAEASFPRRGRRRLAPASLRIADPLGLRSAETRSTDEQQVLVLPRVEPITAIDGDGYSAEGERPEGSERGVGGAGLDAGAVEFEIDGLRPYRDGTPASRIHWPTVARTGELAERKLISGGQASPLVVLDASAPADEESLDAAVRAAASLCLHLARAGGCGLLISGHSRPLEIDAALRAWPDAHAHLALVEAGGPPPRLRRGAGGELLFWVSAAADGDTGHARSPGGGRGYRVSPQPHPGRRTVFQVAGCHGQPLEPGQRQGPTKRARVTA